MDSLKNMLGGATAVKSCMSAANAGMIDRCLHILRSGDPRNASLKVRAAECLCIMMQHPQVRDRELKRGSVGAITSELLVLLQSNVGGSGRAAAAALAGLCASDQGRTIAAALSGKQLAEAAPRLLLAADVQDPVASTNAATVVAQLLHRGGAPAALNAARNGGLVKACALLSRNLPTQAHIAAIDLIVMMCNALGSGGGQLSADEMQALQSIVKFGLHRSWEQGDNGRPIFARAAAACAVLSVDPRRGRVISGATPLLLAALRHPVIISSHQQQQQVVGGWNPRKVMLDILLCVGRLCQDDEAALLAVGNGALPALFGLLGHTEQNVVGFALQALHALSTPGRRSRSAVIATGVDGVLRLTTLLKSPILPAQSMTAVINVLRNLAGVGLQSDPESGASVLASTYLFCFLFCLLTLFS
mgnify:FL=1